MIVPDQADDVYGGGNRGRRNKEDAVGGEHVLQPPAKRPRTSSYESRGDGESSNTTKIRSETRTDSTSLGTASCSSPATAAAVASIVDTPWNSSSTIVLVEEVRILVIMIMLKCFEGVLLICTSKAFHHHHAHSPEESQTSAFSAGQWVHSKAMGGAGTKGQKQSPHSPLQRLLSGHIKNTSGHRLERIKVCSLAESELCSLLPQLEAATLLVDNYFDRIHWFMLLFHQKDFRDKFQSLYAMSTGGGGGTGGCQYQPMVPSSRVGYIAVLLAVCAISLHYTSAQQKHRLACQGIDSEVLKDRILTTLRLKLLDVLSLGSLEAVQVCVLLGSYYLYHGEPKLAWPLCGCGLRIAQALNLHRKLPPPPDQQQQQGEQQQPHVSSYSPENSSSSKSRSSSNSSHQDLRASVEARKRCWWAVYEIETFCSMMYGFPLSITDSDCDVEQLDPYDECSGSAATDSRHHTYNHNYSRGSSASSSADRPTLLFFKCAMSKLSTIVKSALTDLYGTHRNLDKHNKPILDYSSRLQSLVIKVAIFDARLLAWYTNLDPKLRLGHLGNPTSPAGGGHHYHGRKDHQFGTVGPSSGRADHMPGREQWQEGHHDDVAFEEHLFQLQALALKLAYENARILVHRPLLSYKIVGPTVNNGQQPLASVPNPTSTRPDPFQNSIQTCRDAALQNLARRLDAHIQ